MPETLTGRAPTAGANRIAAIDVIRGVAILGTFGTNVWLITEAGGAAGFSFDAADQGGVLEKVLRGIPNGKFLALLTLLFGIGLEMQYRSAVRRGLRWPGRYLRRAAILLLEGLVHYVLIFEYDVLMAYAITSMIVAYLIGRSDRAHRWILWGVGSAYAVLLVAATGLLLLLPPFGTGAGPVPSTASWPDQVWERVVNAGSYRYEAVFIVPSAVLLFLLAARLLRAGVFADTEAGHRRRRRLLGWGFGLGVPINVATVWAGSDWFLVERYVAGPLIAVGALALITTLVLQIRTPGTVQGWLASVGRTGLSCYVLQNLLACALCYDWGAGLNSRLAGLGPFWPVLLWCVIVVVNVVFATLWLRRHDRGPLELVAHRMA